MKTKVRTNLTALIVLTLGLVSAQGATAIEEQVPDSLVFARNGDLFRATIDGSETVQLTTTKARESNPAVSPDRRLIAYTRAKDELWFMNTDGSDQRRLLARRPSSVRYASTGSPSWSPGGRMIYVERWSQPSKICSSIFRIGVNGRGLKRVTRKEPLEETSESDPAVSPDGRRIAISASAYCDPGWAGHLAVIDTTGRPTSDLRKGRSLSGADIQPSWSPDGRRIAFVSWDFLESLRSALYIVNRDGSGLRRLTQSTFETGEPAWSPDGQWIAFHKEGGLHLIRHDGSGLKRVPRTKAMDMSPAWLPRS